MDSQHPYDPYYPTRGESTTSSRYTSARTVSTSSTQHPGAQTQYSQYDYPEEPAPATQHSATFYPSTQDDYFAPYVEHWGSGDFVSTPPPMSPQEQLPSHTQPREVYGNNQSGATNPHDVASSPYLGTGGTGWSPSSGGDPSPTRGPPIYTPSIGSSPSASSPPSSNPIALPAPASAPGYSVDTSYLGRGHIISTSTIPEGKISELSRPAERTSIISKSRVARFQKGNMLPLHEDEVLGTKEIQSQQRLDPMEYSEETGGWVRRARSSVQNRSGSIMRSLTQKLTTYRPLSGEDRDVKKLEHARAIKKDEDNAVSEGYGGVDFDMFGGFDSEVPEQTADAMRQLHGNTDFAYTATGEVVDLSSLQGLNADEDEVDDDGKSRRNSFSLTRSTTGFNPNEKSYYFPEDPDTPNWKPVTMRPLYLTILQVLSLAIIGFCEFLYQYSVRKGRDTRHEPHLTSFKDLADMRLIDFALWKYLPTVIAVVFGVLVQLSDAEVKRVEPYFQLARKPKGARAGDSLNIEYSTFWAVLCPFKAIRHKHWAVMISSVTAILAFAAVPPLQSAFLNLDMNPDNKGPDSKGPNDHGLKFLVVDRIWTRLLEAVMFIIFVLIGVLQWVLLRRKTGLVGDPSGIAGVAAMANKAHILMDFRGLDLAGTEKIHKQLSKRTYILHKSCLWQAEFLKEHERPTETVRDQSAHPVLLRFEGGLPFIGYLVLVMIMLPLSMGKGSLQLILAKSTWFLTVLSISLKMFWEVIDRDLRMLQPFYLLYRRHAHSNVLTLDYTATIPGWIIVKTLQNKHYLLTYITTITLLNEVLTVCMGSLDPVSGDETPRSQQISFALAEVIMLGQVIGVSVVLYLRRHPFLPRQPGTISSVLAYIYASHMLPDFDNMETKSTNERQKILASKNKTYGFGWFKGLVDGKWHVGIDQEELLRSYKPGERFLDSVMQGIPSGLDQL